jgi:phosphatidate cytidylyltransferase
LTRFSSSMTRIVTGLLLAATVVYIVLWGPLYAMVAAQLLFTFAGLWEFYRLSELTGAPPRQFLGYLIALACMEVSHADAGMTRLGYLRLSYFSRDNLLAGAGMLAVLWMAITIVPSMSKFRLLRSQWLATLLGICYVAIPLALLVWIWRQQDGPFHLLFTMVVIWAGDTAGYFIGKHFGKHKSSPHISPNKTWEGTIASFLAALLVGGITAGYSWLRAGYAELLLLAAALNVAGQLGDLAESALKRSAGVKDSSNLIPGHGGVLDRIDALLFAAPVLWYYWLWRVS